MLVVGEEPTGGIHRRQFINAVRWISAIHGSADRPSVGILGPSFTGSIPSLSQLLKSTEKIDPVLHDQTIHGYLATGKKLSIFGITKGYTLDSLKMQADPSLGKQTTDPQLVALNLNLHSFQQEDRKTIALFCQYLGQIQPRSTVAILSEDETDYGSLGGDSQKCAGGVIRLSYPRDISALRAAYQTNSIFNSPSQPESAQSVRRNLPTDLADPEGEEHDTIKSYSGDQLPRAEEAALLNIVASLRAHGSDYIMLRSSNPLDQIFLSRYLQRAYSRGRIVVSGGIRFSRERVMPVCVGP